MVKIVFIKPDEMEEEKMKMSTMKFYLSTKSQFENEVDVQTQAFNYGMAHGLGEVCPEVVFSQVLSEEGSNELWQKIMVAFNESKTNLEKKRKLDDLPHDFLIGVIEMKTFKSSRPMHVLKASVDDAKKNSDYDIYIKRAMILILELAIGGIFQGNYRISNIYAKNDKVIFVDFKYAKMISDDDKNEVARKCAMSNYSSALSYVFKKLRRSDKKSLYKFDDKSLYSWMIGKYDTYTEKAVDSIFDIDRALKDALKPEDDHIFKPKK